MIEEIDDENDEDEQDAQLALDKKTPTNKDDAPLNSNDQLNQSTSNSEKNVIHAGMSKQHLVLYRLKSYLKL